MTPSLVIFGTSNILSDIFDCALANRIRIKKVVIHHPEEVGPRDRSLAQRLEMLTAHGERPCVENLETFAPEQDELYLLGPTTPTRAELAEELRQRFDMRFTRLVHPTAYVSPLAYLSEGVFIGANSVIGPGARLAEHVFVNRGVTIGHDTDIGPFSRIQPGSQMGGLSKVGRGVTVGLGATVLERLVIGEGAFIGAGAVVTADVAPDVLVVGAPAQFKKVLR